MPFDFLGVGGLGEFWFAVHLRISHKAILRTPPTLCLCENKF
jgi:hypothetical protein